MAKKFRATFIIRLSNTIVTALLQAGVKMGTMTLLTVQGRKSGLPRTTPVTLIEQNGQRWLISPYGEVNWVRNIRATGEATITRGRRSEQITVIELSAKEAAVTLKESLGIAPSFLRQYFDVTPASSLEEFEREAPRHPVFGIHSASS